MTKYLWNSFLALAIHGYLAYHTHGFCFCLSVWFLSFHLVICPNILALWLVRIFSLWLLSSRACTCQGAPCSLLGYDKLSREFPVSLLFLPEMIYYVYQLEDAYASGRQPNRLWIQALEILNLILLKGEKHMILFWNSFKTGLPIFLRLTLESKLSCKDCIFLHSPLGMLLASIYWFELL